MKVLVADDDLTSRSMLEAVLTKWNYDVVSAKDGNEAMAVMTGKETPYLAILDWMMPGMDGIEVCRNMRNIKSVRQPYIIMLTARKEKNDIVTGLESGANDYLAKPFDIGELRARVNVGQRMLEMETELLEREKLKGVLEMAGAVCHELNQPLQSVSGYSELLLMDMDPSDPTFEMLDNIKTGIKKIGLLTRKIMTITRYQSKPYVGKTRIVDIDYASSEGSKKT